MTHARRTANAYVLTQLTTHHSLLTTHYSELRTPFANAESVSSFVFDYIPESNA